MNYLPDYAKPWDMCCMCNLLRPEKDLEVVGSVRDSPIYQCKDYQLCKDMLAKKEPK